MRNRKELKKYLPNYPSQRAFLEGGAGRNLYEAASAQRGKLLFFL